MAFGAQAYCILRPGAGALAPGNAEKRELRSVGGGGHVRHARIIAYYQRGGTSQCSKCAQLQGRQAQGVRRVAPGVVGFGGRRAHDHGVSLLPQFACQLGKAGPDFDFPVVQAGGGGRDEYEFSGLQACFGHGAAAFLDVPGGKLQVQRGGSLGGNGRQAPAPRGFGGEVVPRLHGMQGRCRLGDRPAQDQAAAVVPIAAAGKSGETEDHGAGQ